MIVYIDGENFVHHLVATLVKNRRIAKRADLKTFDLTGLCRKVLKTDDITIRYYMTKLKKVLGDVYDAELKQKSKDMINWAGRWRSTLTQEGVTVIKAGNLRIRDGLACRNCGHQETFFQEKGVDVQLAIDLVLEAGEGIMQIILSSDSDLIPAVRAAKLRGARVKNLAGESTINMGLAYACGEWKRFTDDELVAAYDRAKGSKRG